MKSTKFNKPFSVEVQSEDGEALTVEFRRLGAKEVLKPSVAKALEAFENNSFANIDSNLIGDVILSAALKWDWVEDGEPVKLTMESIDQLPFDMQIELFSQIMGKLAKSTSPEKAND